MEDNQDQEQVKPYPILGEGHLWVKLKIPKDDAKRSDFEDQNDQTLSFDEENDDDDDEMKDLSKNMKRVCHVCHKSFSSGKALGGHMRIHVEIIKGKKGIKRTHKTIIFKKQKNFNGGLCDNVMKEPICIICGKEFISMNSLYGHMRCHPDRDWKGVNPPDRTVINASFSSSSCAKVDNVDGDHKQVSEENEAVDDLEKSLRGWKMTGKRGCKGKMGKSKSEFSSSDDHQAVDYLMMLAQGNYHGPTVDKGVEKCVLEGKAVKKLDDCDELDDDHSDYENGELRVVAKSGKKRKKMNLCDLKSARKVTSPISDPVDQEKSYKCNTCGKLFSTHQGLGGHRSRHKKVKIDPILDDSIGEFGDVSNPTARVDEKIDKVLDFDLNELPPLENQY